MHFFDRARDTIKGMLTEPKMEGAVSPPRYLAMRPGVRNMLMTELRRSVIGRRVWAAVLIASPLIPVAAVQLLGNTIKR